jgi:ribose/xylose/arabinose/galactoside ABC-type transport system permease subunit
MSAPRDERSLVSPDPPLHDRLGLAERFNLTTTDVASYVMVTVLVIIGSVFVDGFFETSTMRAILMQGSALGIIALGQMFVVLVSGLDLSVSAVMLFGVIILLKEGTTASTLLVVALVAAGVGLLNGLLVTWRQAPPFVATFGTLIFVGGLEAVYAQGSAGGSVPSWMARLGSGVAAGVPISLFVLVVLSVVVWFVLEHTSFGRWVYAVGTNSRAAVYSGIRVSAVRIACYVLCSLLAVAGALVNAGYTGFVDQNFARSASLDSIAAVLIGGVLFGGGSGKVSGALCGVFIIVLSTNLVSLLGWDIYWQNITVGLILILAVALQSFSAGGGAGRLVRGLPWRGTTASAA